MFNLKFKNRIIFIGILLIMSLAFVLIPGAIVAEGTVEDKYGLEATAGEAEVISSDTDIPAIIGKIVGAGLSFIGILFFILMIYGGFTWMTARGNEEQVKKAIALITQACIGLVIVAAAYLITKFVGESIINAFI